MDDKSNYEHTRSFKIFSLCLFCFRYLQLAFAKGSTPPGCGTNCPTPSTGHGKERTGTMSQGKPPRKTFKRGPSHCQADRKRCSTIGLVITIASINVASINGGLNRLQVLSSFPRTSDTQRILPIMGYDTVTPYSNIGSSDCP